MTATTATTPAIAAPAEPARRVRRRRKVAPPSGAAASLAAELATDRTEDDGEVQVRPPEAIRQSLREMASGLNSHFIDRAHAVTAIQLAMLTGLNYLLVGGPGTGKTALAQCASKHVVGARYFAPSALGAYTTLSDLVGERDIPALMQGVSKRQTRGKLAAVEMATLDELFKTSDPTCNTLLSLMNEREFEGQSTPLHCVGAATNWPEILAMKPIVRAFWDRLHFRVVVEPVKGKNQLRAMLRSGRKMAKAPYVASAGSQVSIDELRACSVVIRNITIPTDVEDLLLSIYERLLNEKIDISGRRLIQFQNILQASAWLAGRDSVNISDFRHLLWCCWTKRDDIPKVKAVVDTVDAEHARKLTAAINQARELHQRFARQGWNVDRAHEFLVKASDVAETVAEALESDALTKQTAGDVQRAAKLLGGEVQAVVKRYGAELGLDE